MESAVSASISSCSVSQLATNSAQQSTSTEEEPFVLSDETKESITLSTSSPSTSAASPLSPRSPRCQASLISAFNNSVRPNLDLSKLYRKTYSGDPFYPSDSSSSNSLSTMLSPEVVTNLALLDTDTDRMLENLNKISIHHQDAEVSLADATDCLRHIGGKLDWYHRKQVFCPHLMSCDDAVQIAGLQQKILYEEIPFLELKNRLKETGESCDFPRELEGRFLQVCGLFIELKNRIGDLINALPDELISSVQRTG